MIADMELDVMDNAQDSLRQESSNADEVMESLGVDPENADESGDSNAKESEVKDDPYSVKKRLGMQAKRHQREMRAMQDQIMQLQAHIGQPRPSDQSSANNPYSNQPSNQGMSEDERIQSAVRYALQAKEAEEHKAKEAERQVHVQKQYHRLNQEFDKASDKYEDFDDVVRGEDVPFTAAIRDALLLIDNPADVVYKLGKNKDELNRISKLHPLDQAREVNKLSFALMGGNGGKSNSNQSHPMSQNKPNPVNSSSANYSPSSIRERMKSGNWK